MYWYDIHYTGICLRRKFVVFTTFIWGIFHIALSSCMHTEIERETAKLFLAGGVGGGGTPAYRHSLRRQRASGISRTIVLVFTTRRVSICPQARVAVAVFLVRRTGGKAISEMKSLT